MSNSFGGKIQAVGGAEHKNISNNIKKALRVDCEEEAYDCIIACLKSKKDRDKVKKVPLSARPESISAMLTGLQESMAANCPMDECDECGPRGDQSDCPRGCICKCKPIMDVPGWSLEMGQKLFSAGAEWGQTEPWLQLRLNHCLRIDVPWAPHFKFVQVIGGGGNCDPVRVADIVYHHKYNAV
jgi:hypothetical protein